MMHKDSGVLKAWEATVRKTQAVAKKRANSIFGTIYMGHAEEEDNSSHHSSHSENCIDLTGEDLTEPLEVHHAEKALPNGEIYIGQWAETFPHGEGKYLWTDGCMYVGEWCKGRFMGQGRFSWPSGATYEGEFKSGYMDGTGTYTGSYGDTYRGQWVMNLKHGEGVEHFVNGDWYEGEWQRGLLDGRGRYEWRDGNHYVGEWKNGSIWGKGSFVWENGNRYDGFWEDGVPKGKGTYKWSDGSFYVGNWSKDPKDQNGTYHLAGSSQEGHPDWDPQEVYNEVNECPISVGEKVTIFPSQKLAVWKSSKPSELKPRRMSVDGRVSVGLEKPNDRVLLSDGAEADHVSGDKTPNVGSDLEEEFQVDEGSSKWALRVPKKSKRQGEIISKGHKNYDLMLNVQLGIRYCHI